ncbi:MAG: hypothetical protein AAF517_24090 [Planctomycetota bacterium]
MKRKTILTTASVLGTIAVFAAGYLNRERLAEEYYFWLLTSEPAELEAALLASPESPLGHALERFARRPEGRDHLVSVFYSYADENSFAVWRMVLEGSPPEEGFLGFYLLLDESGTFKQDGYWYPRGHLGVRDKKDGTTAMRALAKLLDSIELRDIPVPGATNVTVTSAKQFTDLDSLDLDWPHGLFFRQSL